MVMPLKLPQAGRGSKLDGAGDAPHSEFLAAASICMDLYDVGAAWVHGDGWLRETSAPAGGSASRSEGMPHRPASAALGSRENRCGMSDGRDWLDSSLELLPVDPRPLRPIVVLPVPSVRAPRLHGDACESS